jgi:acetate kinase
MVVRNSEGVVSKEELPVSLREQVIRHLLRTLHDGNARAIGSTLEIDAVGHRVVHGGAHFKNPVVIKSVSAFALHRLSGG